MKAYQTDHTGIKLDQDARSLKHSKVSQISEEEWKVEQTLIDFEGHNDWVLTITASTQGLKFISLDQIA
jgi:hypothetical protein